MSFGINDTSIDITIIRQNVPIRKTTRIISFLWVKGEGEIVIGSP